MTIERTSSVSVARVDHTSVLQMRGISKRFGGLQALDDASLDLRGGKVLALCGANGAGKSTLVRILAGVEHADHGEIVLDGHPVTIASPQHAGDLGLSFVHQELNLVPKFTGIQNMAMGAGARTWGLVATKALRRRAVEVRELLGYDVPLDVPVEQLSISDRWMVSLARSLMRPARFIALDEPTASFTQEEAELLYGVVRELTATGVGVLYISHRLEEVLHISDEVTIMRDGRVVGSHRAAGPRRRVVDPSHRRSCRGGGNPSGQGRHRIGCPRAARGPGVEPRRQGRRRHVRSARRGGARHSRARRRRAHRAGASPRSGLIGPPPER